MNIKSLVPWNWGRKNIPIRREEDHPVYSLQRTVNRVFDNFFEGFSLSSFGSLEDRMRSFTPRVDISESDKEFQVTAELPGMDEKAIFALMQKTRFEIMQVKPFLYGLNRLYLAKPL